MKTIEEEIIGLLKRNKELSTYEIAKKLKISWSTAKFRLLKLALEGKITYEEMKLTGDGKIIFWKLKK